MTEQSRLLRLPEVCDRVALKKSTVYELINNGEFPIPLRITRRTVGWLEGEIEAFIQARIRARAPSSR